MTWQRIRGHTEQVDMFRRAIRRGRLSHSYLFVGPEGIGKKLFAHTLAQSLHCLEHPEDELQACGQCSSCKQVHIGSHPDLISVGCPEGKQELPVSVFVGPKENRGKEGLCYELSLRPMSGNRKIAVIDDANLMNEESSNALLKTLEEPPVNSLLILIATNSEGILPTIRSRCQLIRFAPLQPEDLVQLLLEQQMCSEPQEAQAIAGLSDGSLATASQLLAPELRTLRETLYRRLADRNFDSVRIAAEMISGVEELGGDAAEQRKLAGWLVRFCLEFFRQCTLELSGNPQRSPVPQVQQYVQRFNDDSPENIELLMALFDRAALAERQLEQRMSAPLCLEGLFDELGRLSRTALV